MSSFETHVFISYAHLDNDPLPPAEKGWISRFHSSLKSLLSTRYGKAVKIWRDDKLQGNDIFGNEIVERFSGTAVMVSILSPRYIESKWCTKEISEFCSTAEQYGGIVIGNKARVFKVLKTPVDSQDPLPEAAKGALGYPFYKIVDDVPYELDRVYGEEFGLEYNQKLAKLAYEISELLKKLAIGADGKGNGNGGMPAKPTVYLAECSYDRLGDREKLEGDLRRNGYKVLPDRQLPRYEKEYEVNVEDCLKRSNLSVHLVGDQYGLVPNGPTIRSETIIQNEIAAEIAKDDELKRVIWLPEGTSSDEAEQQAFIDLLHNNADAQFGADMITGDLEALKSAVRSALEHLEKREAEVSPKPAAGNGKRMVYVICDEKDRRATIPLRKFCKSKGFDVEIPVFEGNAAAIREANQELATSCDAAIIFYGMGDELWKRTVDKELRKMSAFRAGKPPLTKFTYLADPQTSAKEELMELEEPNLIDGLREFSESEMMPFVNALSQLGETS